jgi:hypothetical protein
LIGALIRPDEIQLRDLRGQDRRHHLVSPRDPMAVLREEESQAFRVFAEMSG